MIIDTHAHIYLEQFDQDRAQVIERAGDWQVGKIFLPNIDHTSIDGMLELTQQYPHVCYPMMGLHPCSVKKDFQKELYLVEDWLGKMDFLAVGEIGLDYFWDKTFMAGQAEAFRIQCDLALKHRLPIVIHSRESIDDCIDLVKPFVEKGLLGVFHCFTGDQIQAEKIIEMGFYLGLGGVTTFKNSGLYKVVPEIGLDKIILETDSPYLAPVPHRGKRNEPAYTSIVRDWLSGLLGKPKYDVDEITTKNALNLFSRLKE